MGSLFEPVRPKRLADGAIEQIIGLVREGRLAPGTKLPSERELVELLAVSRTPLREAIRILEAMGVLRVVPGKGTFVRDGAPDVIIPETAFSWLTAHRAEVLQLMEMHEALESRMAALAAERADAGQIEQLERDLEDMRRALAAGDQPALVQADAVFHHTIHQASGNGIIARFLGDLDELAAGTRELAVSLPSRPRRIIPEHEAIYQAIAARDPVAASAAVLVHVQRSKDEIVALIQAGELRAGVGADPPPRE